jgi:hypothetical protein
VTQPVLLPADLTRYRALRAHGAEANDGAISIASAQLAIRSLTDVATASPPPPPPLLPFAAPAARVGGAGGWGVGGDGRNDPRWRVRGRVSQSGTGTEECNYADF